MNTYQVGQPYIVGRTRWPEAVEYNYRQGAHELRMFMRHITAKERSDIRRGPAEFAVVVHEPIIFMLYRFGAGAHPSIPWSDAPYSIHMVPADQRTTPPDLAASAGVLLQIVLVNAETGLIEALRVVSLSPHLSRHLHAAIQTQAARPFDPDTYDAALAAAYQRYPTSDALLTTALARSHGGD